MIQTVNIVGRIGVVIGQVHIILSITRATRSISVAGSKGLKGQLLGIGISASVPHTGEHSVAALMIGRITRFTPVT